MRGACQIFRFLFCVSSLRDTQFLFLRIFIISCLLTVHPGMILVNNQIDAPFFIYVYFCSLHISGSHVLIIRRIIVSMRHLAYVTLCRLPFGVHTRRSSTQSDINQVLPDGHLHIVTRNRSYQTAIYTE